jgi:hypothetical protein
MARSAYVQRPPIIATACLAAVTVLLGPATHPAPVAAMGPPPICHVAGERHGEFYVPEGHWTMPTFAPLGHWNMPNPLGPNFDDTAPLIDVDRLVSGLKRMLTTPRT